MVKLPRLLLVLIVLLLVVPAAPALAQAETPPLWPGCQDDILPTGAHWLICMPERLGVPGPAWNGSLVVFAHGYVPNLFATPQIPLDQLQRTTPAIPELVNGFGYAFATTSYRVNGLAIQQGAEDLVQLVAKFNELYQLPPGAKVYVVGVSEGGLVTAQAIEQSDVFSGGVAACGPIGDFQKQINYIGDFRVVFDYFFPKVFRNQGTAVSIPPELIAGWAAKEAEIGAVVMEKPSQTNQLLRVTLAATDPNDSNTRAETAQGVLWYNIFGTTDAEIKLGGQPFDNRHRVYLGSNNDLALNLKVKRYAADDTARAAVQAGYQTTGRLPRPLATIHDIGDPIVPYWHEALYLGKVLARGSLSNYWHLPVARYGHCEFKAEEILAAFNWVRVANGEPPILNAQNVLADDAANQRYQELQRRSAAPADQQPKLAPQEQWAPAP